MGNRTSRSIRVRGPLARSDLPGLYARVCRALGEQAGTVAVCDVGHLSADAVAVEALCRLQLGAKQHGREVRLRNASRELLELVRYLGLDDVLRPELRVEM